MKAVFLIYVIKEDRKSVPFHHLIKQPHELMSSLYGMGYFML